MGRVLVTGAAGFIGSHLVERLLAEDREVVGVDSFTGYYSRERKERNLATVVGDPCFELVEGDLLTLGLEELLSGMEAVLHLAGEPGVRRSWGGNFQRYVERNVLTTQRLLEAVSGSDIRFVYVSSSSVYGGNVGGPAAEDDPRQPASPYGMSKLAAEELVALYGRERGVPATVLRYFTVYGPRQRPEMALAHFLFAARKGRPVEVFGDGEQTRDMTYVMDAVEATAVALEAAPGVYNVGGGTRATVNDMLDVVRQVTGTEVEVRYGPAAAGDVRSTWADSRRAARELGYAPRTGLEEGIAAQAEWALRESPVAEHA
ncbi:MAG: GDP-mannose 4,6-dehydratase [Actinomycetota bacterium]|nr:GDP-mannose 4,6-dehydratase [Actinomycetota bacterium]